MCNYDKTNILLLSRNILNICCPCLHHKIMSMYCIFMMIHMLYNELLHHSLNNILENWRSIHFGMSCTESMKCILHISTGNSCKKDIFPFLENNYEYTMYKHPWLNIFDSDQEYHIWHNAHFKDNNLHQYILSMLCYDYNYDILQLNLNIVYIAHLQYKIYHLCILYIYCYLNISDSFDQMMNIIYIYDHLSQGNMLVFDILCKSIYPYIEDNLLDAKYINNTSQHQYNMNWIHI